MTFDNLFHRDPYTTFQNTKKKNIIELAADETLALIQKLRASMANQNIDCPVRNIKCVNEFGPAAIYKLTTVERNMHQRILLIQILSILRVIAKLS